jgi:hypothetical protein
MRAVRAAAMSAALLATTIFPAVAETPSTGPGNCRDALVVARGTTRVIDPDELTSRQLSRADRMLRRVEHTSEAAPIAAKARVPIDVYAHVLRSKTRGGVPLHRVERQVAVMNAAYAGQQSARAATAPFHFRLVDRDVSVDRSWYRMNEGSSEGRAAKRSLHRGGTAALNLYIGSNANGVLGWATQPTRLGVEPLMDGVVIARHTMPGGAGGHYSAGDAAVHETGHWLGLFHTFAGKCGQHGDFVKDTPAERRPSYSCPVGRDTCTAKGKDPVHNFMDYSYDSCMYRFTDGQVARMVRSWNAFRDTADRRSSG